MQSQTLYINKMKKKMKRFQKLIYSCILVSQKKRWKAQTCCKKVSVCWLWISRKGWWEWSFNVRNEWKHLMWHEFKKKGRINPKAIFHLMSPLEHQQAQGGLRVLTWRNGPLLHGAAAPCNCSKSLICIAGKKSDLFPVGVGQSFTLIHAIWNLHRG